MAVVTRTTAITRAIRTPTGVTAYPGGITRTRITAVIRTVATTTTTRTMAVIRTVATTGTRTTHQPTAITDQQLQLCSSALADSVTTTAESTETSGHRPVVLSRLSKAGTAWLWTG